MVLRAWIKAYPQRNFNCKQGKFPHCPFISEEGLSKEKDAQPLLTHSFVSVSSKTSSNTWISFRLRTTAEKQCFGIFPPIVWIPIWHGWNEDRALIFCTLRLQISSKFLRATAFRLSFKPMKTMKMWRSHILQSKSATEHNLYHVQKINRMHNEQLLRRRAKSNCFHLPHDFSPVFLWAGWQVPAQQDSDCLFSWSKQSWEN